MATVREETYEGGVLVGSRDIQVPPEQTNRDDLQAKAIAALDANATYLALASPTNAQNVAQVQRLTRECSGLIRLLLGRFDSTEGT